VAKKRKLSELILNSVGIYLCRFCGCPMVHAWHGKTPTNFPLDAYICPKCYSTRYIGVEIDPTFKMLKAIQAGFMSVWRKRGS